MILTESVFISFSINPIYSSVINIERNFSRSYKNRDKDLNVIVMNTKEKIVYLRQLLNVRKRIDKSFWVIDISYYEKLQTAYQNLNHIHMDIDDDFYFIKQGFDKIDVWEIYKISPNHNISANYLGYWTKNNGSGLLLDQKTKAWRRRNLNGYHFKVTTKQSKPSITGYTKHSVSGIFGDIFEELKVGFKIFPVWCLLLFKYDSSW